MTVTFDGIDHPGIIEKAEASGYYRCQIAIDPTADYGHITPRMAPHTTVAVKANNIKPCDTPSQ